MVKAIRPVCRHCRAAPVWRPRGLCWKCYANERVRDLYPVGSGTIAARQKYLSRGLSEQQVEADLPPEVAHSRLAANASGAAAREGAMSEVDAEVAARLARGPPPKGGRS